MIHGSERAPPRFLPTLCWAVQVTWEVAGSYFDQSAVVDEVCCEDSMEGAPSLGVGAWLGCQGAGGILRRV